MCPCGISPPLTVMATSFASAPIGIPATRTASRRPTTIPTLTPSLSTLCTVRLERAVLHLLPHGDSGLDTRPHQLRPACISQVRWMIAIRPDELRPEGNLPLADGIEVNELGTVRAALAFNRLVEGDGLTADRVSRTAITEARSHRQVGNQVHDDHRRRLVAQAPEDRVEAALVHAHRHPRRDVVRSDRERDQLRTLLDRAADLTKEHIGRGRAAQTEVDHS